MNSTTFSKLIIKLEKQQLGGLDSQFKLAPKMRLKYNDDMIAAKNPKKAAVLSLFYPDNQNQIRILLTLRASYNGTHSAQISFPGGKVEKNDINLKETALRETFEEMGFNTSKVIVFKQLTNVYIPPSNFLVAPFLGFIDKKPVFKTNHEVESLIEIKLSDLLNNNSVSSTNISTSYANKISVPCFKLNGYDVWGATAMMLSEIKDLILKIS